MVERGRDLLGKGEPVVLVVAGIRENVDRGQGCRLSQDGVCCKGRRRLAIMCSTTGKTLISLCEGTTLTFKASLQKSVSC